MVTQILFLLIGAVLLLGAGLGIVWMIPPLRRAVTAIESIPCALLLGSGVTGLWTWIGQMAGLKLGVWSVILLGLSAVALALGILQRLRNRAEERAVSEPRVYRTILLGLATLAFLLMLREGGSLGPVHDSLDFVSFVQESLQTGDLSPRSAIYRTGPEVPPDPRRGSFHTQVAALCRLSGASPTDGWRWLPRLLAPLAILGLGAMLRPWIGARAAWLAVAFFIATTFFSRDRFIQNIGYASRFGWMCGWAGLLALGQGLALGHRGRTLLILAAASPTILFSAHILSGLQVLLALGCAGIAVWIARASSAEERRSVLTTLIAAVVLLVPVVAIRFSRGVEVGNILFDHLYGVLLVARNWPVLHPDFLMERFGAAGYIGAALGLLLLPAARRNRAAGFLAFSTAIPLVILFFPPIVRIVLAVHAQSMLLRVILTIPFAATLGWTTLAAVDDLKGRTAASGAAGPVGPAGGMSAAARKPGDERDDSQAGRGRRRGTRAPLFRKLRALLLLAIVAAATIAQAVATRSAWLIPEHQRGDYAESLPLVRALDFAEREFDPVQTILSDPISSYAIPAYTHHDAVAPYHQHSSPSDPSALSRMQDVQEALNPRVGMGRTFAVLRRYHVDLVLLNQSWPRYISSYGVFISPLVYADQRRKLDAEPALFQRIYDADGIAIYRVHDPGIAAALPGDPPNPSRIADPGGGPLLSSGPDALLRFEPRPGPHPRGKPVIIDLVWRRTAAPYRLPIVCEVKLVHRDRSAAYETPIVGRLTRWITERREASRIRFGAIFRPLVTFYPDFLWAPGEVYKDDYMLQIPPTARPGIYEIRARLGEAPYSKVATLSEIWSNRLGSEWRQLGEIEIEK
jgi:hypothetical protein